MTATTDMNPDDCRSPKRSLPVNVVREDVLVWRRQSLMWTLRDSYALRRQEDRVT